MKLIKPGIYHRDGERYECYQCGAVIELSYQDFASANVQNIEDRGVALHCPSCNLYAHFKHLAGEDK